MARLSLITPQTKAADTEAADPLRAELAQAIGAAKAAKDAVARLKAAIERTRNSVREAEKAVKTAEEEVGKARAAHAQALADAAASEAAPPTSGIARARQTVVELQDEADSLKVALDALKAKLPEVEATAKEREIAVDVAISGAIMAPAAERLLERARAIRQQLSPLKQILRQIFSDDPARGTTTNDDYLHAVRRQAPLAEVRLAIEAFLREGDTVPAAENPWRAARERLRADPFAPLPDFAPPPPDPAA